MEHAMTNMSQAGSASSTISIDPAMLDQVLVAQFAVAWAGEGGEDPRLGWWRSELVSEYGGEDLFRRLMPDTWMWAVLQGAREAARRKDEALRRQDADPDRIFSLFRFGFELDERIEERLLDLKRANPNPYELLPGLKDHVRPTWDRERFEAWVKGQGSVRTGPSSVGRRIEGDIPEGLDAQVKRLVGALHPLGDAYALPHFRSKA